MLLILRQRIYIWAEDIKKQFRINKLKDWAIAKSIAAKCGEVFVPPLFKVIYKRTYSYFVQEQIESRVKADIINAKEIIKLNKEALK